MIDSKLKLAPSVIKKYEPKLGKYCFYNAKEKFFWNCEYAVGAVVSALDGTLSVQEVLDIVISNNQDLNPEDLKETLLSAFEVLLKEGFLVNLNK